MPIGVQAVVLSGNPIFATVDPPDGCPICHRSVEPRLLSASIYDGELEVVFRCPHKSCQKVFIARYTFAGLSEPHRQDPQFWRFVGSLPTVALPRVFDEEIKKLSPAFVTIYNQSVTAESSGLDQLCGTGYRKSLEFLVKDYVKTLPANSGKGDEIERTFLGVCIDKYVTDPRVKATAKRAAWLGNDETHYVKKWEDKDVDDLKKVIDLTLHWISSEILTRELEVSMPESGRSEARDERLRS